MEIIEKWGELSKNQFCNLSLFHRVVSFGRSSHTPVFCHNFCCSFSIRRYPSRERTYYLLDNILCMVRYCEISPEQTVKKSGGYINIYFFCSFEIENWLCITVPLWRSATLLVPVNKVNTHKQQKLYIIHFIPLEIEYPVFLQQKNMLHVFSVSKQEFFFRVSATNKVERESGSIPQSPWIEDIGHFIQSDKVHYHQVKE